MSEEINVPSDYLQSQARKETRQPNSSSYDLVLSRFGGEEGMDAQIHLDIIVQCPKCRRKYRKTVKFCLLGQDVTLACDDCGRSASFRIM